MTETCTCLDCALAKFFNDRFPQGFDTEETIAALTAIAPFAGFLLAPAGEQTLQSFIRLMVGHRDKFRETEQKPGGGLH